MSGIQLTTSPIARGYRRLCGAMKIFTFVALLAIRKVTPLDHAQDNIKKINFEEHISIGL